MYASVIAIVAGCATTKRDLPAVPERGIPTPTSSTAAEAAVGDTPAHVPDIPTVTSTLAPDLAPPPAPVAPTSTDPAGAAKVSEPPANPGPPGAGDCLQYGTDGIVLEGLIERATFPGPPNYEDIAKGDAKETCWLLRVARPFCVDASFDLSGNVDEAAHSRVDEIQLVFVDGHRSYEVYRALVGRRVRAIGELFGAVSGHHHTDVLMNVAQLTSAQHSGERGK